jgi:hypothetical protein
MVDRVTFQDFQQTDNPLNGTGIDSTVGLTNLFESLKTREPFLFELRGNNGFSLTIGFAGDRGCVQHAPCDGSPPYLMAVAEEVADDDQFIEFLAGDTPTPISRRFCLPIARVEEIAVTFLARGGRSESVAWEEI